MNKSGSKPTGKPIPASYLRNANSHTLERGTDITCPRKGHKIGEIKQDLITHGPISMDSIEFEPGQERLAGETPKCKMCSSQYFVQGKIHTDDGWKPNDPILETPP